MANETITDLTLVDALAAADVLALDDASDLSTDPDFLDRPKTKKVTAAQILAYIVANANLNDLVAPDAEVSMNSYKITNLATRRRCLPENTPACCG